MRFFQDTSHKMLFGSIFAGLLYGIVGEVLFKVLYESVPSTVFTLIYFLGLFGIIGIALYALAKLVSKKYTFSVLRKPLLLSFISLIVASLLFEFIYDIINPHKKTGNYTSYMFLIDNSGSMEENDPEGLRYRAIEELLSDKPDKFEFGVISFADSVEVVRDMKPKSEGIELGTPNNYGGTRLKAALQFLQDKIEDKELAVSKKTRTILLTDGVPTDVSTSTGLMSVLKYYSQKGISISTVGLYYSDEQFMQMIAEKTGGVYVKCDDVQELNEALKSASSDGEGHRNLLGYRDSSYLPILLGILRVIFVSGLGVIIAIEKAAICDILIDSSRVLVTSLICGLISGLCIEIGMNVIGINPSVMRVFTCVLLALTLADKDLGNYTTEDFSEGKTLTDDW